MRLKSIILFFFLLTGLTARSQDEKWKVLETEADTLLNHEDYEGALKLYSKILDNVKPEINISTSFSADAKSLRL